MAFILDPVFPLRDICPGPDIGQPPRQCVDIAFGLVNSPDCRCQPVGGDASAAKAPANQKGEDPGQKRGVFGPPGGAEVGDAANIPQQLHPFGFGQPVLDLGQGSKRLERQHVIGITRPGQPIVRGRGLQAADQPVGTAKVEDIVAPMELFDRRKVVGLDRLDKVIVKRAGFACHAKGAVLGMAPGTSGDLGQFLGVQGAHPAAIELGCSRKGRVFDVEVEAHADGIGCDQIIHVTVLIKRHLGVARAGAKGPHDHRTPALLTPDQFCNSIHIFNRKPHDRAAWGHPAYLFRT